MFAFCSPETLIAETVDYLDKLLISFLPTKALILVADGIIPRQKYRKLNLDYIRRAHEREELIKVRGGAIQDEIAKLRLDEIIPMAGTSFSKALEKHLNYYISKKTEEDGRWRAINVIISDLETKGDASEKIFSFLNGQLKQNPSVETATHYIFSHNEDLILRALGNKAKHIAILSDQSDYTMYAQASSLRTKKEDYLYAGCTFRYVNLIKEYIHLEFQEVAGKVAPETILPDFIFLLSLFGNEYQPEVFGFTLNSGILDNILSEYKNFLVKNGKTLLTKEFGVDKEAARLFFSNLNTGAIYDKLIESVRADLKDPQLGEADQKSLSKLEKSLETLKTKKDEGIVAGYLEPYVYPLIATSLSKDKLEESDIKELEEEFPLLVDDYLISLLCQVKRIFTEGPHPIYRFEFTPTLNHIVKFTGDNWESIKTDEVKESKYSDPEEQKQIILALCPHLNKSKDQLRVVFDSEGKYFPGSHPPIYLGEKEKKVQNALQAFTAYHKGKRKTSTIQYDAKILGTDYAAGIPIETPQHYRGPFLDVKRTIPLQNAEWKSLQLRNGRPKSEFRFPSLDGVKIIKVTVTSGDEESKENEGQPISRVTFTVARSELDPKESVGYFRYPFFVDGTVVDRQQLQSIVPETSTWNAKEEELNYFAAAV